ncbi:hypothetical protein B0J18DRAFT_437771 [Chaetomium sp. MPI-SDFR-AT-0129]|nr:hypothetical protein B0J18DRAFT_437771 [Chaetomium sp. MPI-SDFR-AT-0129]
MMPCFRLILWCSGGVSSSDLSPRLVVKYTVLALSALGPSAVNQLEDKGKRGSGMDNKCMVTLEEAEAGLLR